MLDLAALSIVFLIVSLAVPYTAASIVGGTAGLALSHAFEAAYLARTLTTPMVSAVKSISRYASDLARGRNLSDLDMRLAYGRDVATGTRIDSSPTVPLARPHNHHHNLATVQIERWCFDR